MARQLTAGLPLIVVMPAGGRGGFYSDWYNGGDFGPPMYETYHVDELIPWIDERFRTEAPAPGPGDRRAVDGRLRVDELRGPAPGHVRRRRRLLGRGRQQRPGVRPASFDLLPGLDGGEPNAVWGPAATEMIRRRAHNPVDLASNLRGMRLVLRTGNGLPGGEFGGGPDPIEVGVHQPMSTLHETLAELGFPHTWEDYGPGAHQWPYWARDLEKTLPQLMQTLEHPPPRPRRVDYRAVEPRYEVFGWHVAIERKVLEFSRLSRASKRGFTLSGSGRALVRTPAAYRPGRRYRVRLKQRRTSTAARLRQGLPPGRLRIAVPLGPSNDVAAGSARRRDDHLRGRGSRSAVPEQALDGAHQLGGALVGAVLAAADDAMVGVVLEQAERDLVERGLHGRDLGDDVDAVAVLVDHLLDAAHLPLDPPQALLQRLLVVAVPVLGALAGGHGRILALPPGGM